VPGFVGWRATAAGRVAEIATTLTFADRLGRWKARWGIGRMSYLVPAGLYAIGTPTPGDSVVVTANYKMSYDIVRQALAGRNSWLLVLETFGINVWCAAGKGTFGTDELVRRIEVTGLAGVVSHRRLLLPILGAPGVAAYEVTRRTGFSLRYATIRAEDLREYLDNGMMTTPAMREQTFTFPERLALVPVEVVMALKPTLLVCAVLFLVAAAAAGPAAGLKVLLAWLGAVVTGTAVTPLLLPWLPGPSFALKGTLMGLAWSIAWYLLAGGAGWGRATIIAAFLALPAVSAFYALNFTGSTPFTSRSGVKREMRLAIPAMGCALLAAGAVWLAGKFL
jgi:acetyl-CoA decarbonylase/synthase complex subunit gamma